MSPSIHTGAAAIAAKGWLSAHKWLILRRLSQFGFMSLFMAGPLAGIWFVKGNLNSSLTLDTLPLTDPLILLQTFLAGHAVADTALLGAGIVAVFYALVGGRTYCAFVCPMNLVTDAARWLSKRLNLPKGWQPNRNLRLWVLGAVLLSAALSGALAWEYLNPVAALHRGLIFGMGYTWTLVLAVFLFDLFVSRRGWCGHLCPTGAFYGLVGSFSPLRVSAKHREACNDCMDCFAVCPEPHVISPALRGTAPDGGPMIRSRDCTNCGRCIDVCAENVFAFDVRYLKAKIVTPVSPLAGTGH